MMANNSKGTSDSKTKDFFMIDMSKVCYSISCLQIVPLSSQQRDETYMNKSFYDL